MGLLVPNEMELLRRLKTQLLQYFIGMKRFKKFLARIERKTAITTHPQDSISLVIIRRLRVLAFCLYREASTISFRQKGTKQLRNSKNSKGLREALVLGNGPSINAIDWEKLALEKSNLDVFVVNWFVLSANMFVPDYVVLSDPAMHPLSKSDERNSLLWKKLEELNSVILIVPVSWFRVLRNDSRFNQRIICFVDSSLEGWWTGISPLLPRGYASLTAYKALAVANYFGYSRISILGIDNTMFRGLHVSSSNQILLKDHHFYSSDKDDDLSNFFPNGVADYFYDLSLCFIYLKSCFSKLNHVVNLDELSLVDTFTKSKSHASYLN